MGIAVVFIAIAFYSFNSSSIEYSSFKPAKENGKKVQVIGQLDKDKPYTYNAAENKFIFYMKDKEKGEARIVFNGSKPNNFDLAVYFVVTGQFRNDEFIATDILTKCPSKYEGSINDMK